MAVWVWPPHAAAVVRLMNFVVFMKKRVLNMEKVWN